MSGQSRELGRLREYPATRALQVPPCCDAHCLFCDEAWAAIAEKLHLSARQVEILRHTLADQSDKEIARALGLSQDTVHTHMRRLHEKLQAHSRVELAARVFAACLVWHIESPPPTGCNLRRRLESL